MPLGTVSCPRLLSPAFSLRSGGLHRAASLPQALRRDVRLTQGRARGGRPGTEPQDHEPGGALPSLSCFLGCCGHSMGRWDTDPHTWASWGIGKETGVSGTPRPRPKGGPGASSRKTIPSSTGSGFWLARSQHTAHTHMRVHTHTRTCTHAHAYAHACTHACTDTCAHTHPGHWIPGTGGPHSLGSGGPRMTHSWGCLPLDACKTPGRAVPRASILPSCAPQQHGVGVFSEHEAEHATPDSPPPWHGPHRF